MCEKLKLQTLEMSLAKQNKEMLGKGIRSLLQSIDTDLKTTTGNLKTDVVEAATNVMRIALENILPNPKNPRKDFDEIALQEEEQQQAGNR